MRQTTIDSIFGPAVAVHPAPEDADVIIVCEHASNHVPGVLDNLGVEDAVLTSHVAWDPGARDVARHLADRFRAPLVEGRISRLVYDCNRPPEAHDAIPVRSEKFDIPGNANLSATETERRVANVYDPFRLALAGEIRDRRRKLETMITVHSFTPSYLGVDRDVQIGILHGTDTRLAQAMMGAMPEQAGHIIRLNEPYSAADGVSHTLDLHGFANGLLSVMIEIRNDLIQSDDQQRAMAALLGDWIERARQTEDVS